MSSCGADEAEPLPDEVIAQLDIANNAIADLTFDGSDVPANELRQSVLRAQAAGTTLRIVVADANGEFVPAKGVVDRYGGTAISYQATRAAFEGASRDLSAEQLDRAVDAAKVEFDIGESAAAFVNVLETEGIDGVGPNYLRWALFALLALAALFMLSGVWSYMRARKRRLKRHRQFVERKAILVDWAGQLGPEVDALRPLVVASPDNAAQRSWHDSEQLVGSISTMLGGANTIGDLDVAEMRIGQAANKLRNLRVSLGE